MVRSRFSGIAYAGVVMMVFAGAISMWMGYRGI